jgi:hypothetical protein
MGINSLALTEMSGHVNQVHVVHLLGNCLISFVAQGSEVGVQVTKHDGQAATLV